MLMQLARGGGLCLTLRVIVTRCSGFFPVRLFTPLRISCIPYASPSQKGVLRDGHPR